MIKEEARAATQILRGIFRCLILENVSDGLRMSGSSMNQGGGSPSPGFKAAFAALSLLNRWGWRPQPSLQTKPQDLGFPLVGW